MDQYTLIFDSFQKNLCKGLSALQQNGEFVDMTLAADGYYVKVHQMVMALASPYIKELIKTANCPHPTIFLNNISYGTLCSLLEYIYTGEVVITNDNVNNVLQAGKSLHIKGLDTMMPIMPESLSHQQEVVKTNDIKQMEPNLVVLQDDAANDTGDMLCDIDTSDNENYVMNNSNSALDTSVDTDTAKPNNIRSSDPQKHILQYTTSNQGSLQLIVNRYIYYVRHVRRDNTRQWRCLNYINPKKGPRCPASIKTKNNTILKRCGVHNHLFHDEQIMKKIKNNAVFSTIQEAEKIVSKRDKPSEK